MNKQFKQTSLLNSKMFKYVNDKQYIIKLLILESPSFQALLISNKQI